MAAQSLIVFVEGPHDELFFRRILQPELSRVYRSVTVIPHSAEKDAFVDGICSVCKTNGERYALVVDRDSAEYPCRTECKSRWTRRYPQVDDAQVHIVEEEIEGWYLAGAASATLRTHGILQTIDTSTLTKEDFERLVPKEFTPLQFKAELLGGYSLPHARARNASLDRFCMRHGLGELVPMRA